MTKLEQNTINGLRDFLNQCPNWVERFDISETERDTILENARTMGDFIRIWENETFWQDERLNQ